MCIIRNADWVKVCVIVTSCHRDILFKRFKNSYVGIVARKGKHIMSAFLRDIVFCMQRPHVYMQYLLFKQKAEQRYQDYLRGKSVALIGPADTLVGHGLGEMIDAYDIVVRLNAAMPRNKADYLDYGSRTDILYHCMVEYSGRDFASLVDNWGLSYLSSSYPDTIWRTRRDNMAYFILQCMTPFRVMSKSVWRRVKKSVKSRPNTGTMAVADLLNSGISELFVGGFSFYNTGYINGYHNEHPTLDHYLLRCLGHDQDDQINYFKKVVSSDSRVKLDSYLNMLIRNYKYGQMHLEPVREELQWSD